MPFKSVSSNKTTPWGCTHLYKFQ